MMPVLVGEGSPGVPESLHVATLAVTLLTPVDVVPVCPHNGSSPQLGLQLAVVDEQPLVDLSLAAQGSLQLVDTANGVQDLVVVGILHLLSARSLVQTQPHPVVEVFKQLLEDHAALSLQFDFLQSFEL